LKKRKKKTAPATLPQVVVVPVSEVLKMFCFLYMTSHVFKRHCFFVSVEMLNLIIIFLTTHTCQKIYVKKFYLRL